MPHVLPHASLHDGAARPAGRDPLTIAAFAGTAILGGGSAVAIKLGFVELAPFWGAALRFLLASLVLIALMAVMRLALPRGRALLGVVIYGILNFGLNFMLGYWALMEVTAGTAMVVLAIVPLLTLFLAVVQRVERFHVLGLVGGLIAVTGIAVVFRESLGVASPWALLALLGAALSMSEAGIVIKKYPRVHPVVENALAMAIGGALLLALSAFVGERWVIPAEAATRLSLLYLIVFGSVGVFILYLLVLRRWTASGASYVMLITPLVTIILGAIFLGEPVSPSFLVGGTLVLAGVYVGAFLPGRSKSHG